MFESKIDSSSYALTGIYGAGAPQTLKTEAHEGDQTQKTDKVGVAKLGTDKGNPSHVTTAVAAKRPGAPDTYSLTLQDKNNAVTEALPRSVKSVGQDHHRAPKIKSSSNPFKKIVSLISGHASHAIEDSPHEHKVGHAHKHDHKGGHDCSAHDKPHSFGDWQSKIPKSYRELKTPTGNDFCKALGVKNPSSLKTPQQANLAQALDSYGKIGDKTKAPGLAQAFQALSEEASI